MEENINELHETHIEAIWLQYLLKKTFEDFAGDIPSIKAGFQYFLILLKKTMKISPQLQ